MLIAFYPQVKFLHITCVVLSGSLFTLRGMMMLAGSPWVYHPILKRGSYLIDTTLLAAGITLTVMLHQYPFVQAWLTAKVLLLVAYIVLGVFALRRGRTRTSRAGFFIAALAVYLFIVSIAIAHDPRGIFTQIVH
ncbi:MAG: SirB2 family protein [Proteobacteria bacterium]|nr:SirB2 family protein [Pseudomonadota bacterium]